MSKRILSILTAVLLLCTAILPVSADSNYNDTTIQWGEHTTHVYDYCSDRSCNVCGALRATEHVYDNVCDPDCYFCGETRIVPGHQYDYVCDAECNLCGEIRTIQHVYVNACDPTCNFCGAIREVGDHFYDDSLDPECNECGVTRGIVTIIEQPRSVCVANEDEAVVTFTVTGDGLTYAWYYAQKDSTTFRKTSYGVKNRYSTTMNSTRDGYQLYCIITDQYENSVTTDTVVIHMLPHEYANDCDADCDFCGEARQVGDHVYDNACDTDCNICGAVRTIQHTYDNACDAACNVCGASREVSDHVYDNACDANCNECDAIRIIQHTYDNACDAVCNVCGASREVNDHVYDNACDANCNVCDALRQVPDHIYDNGNDTECNVCGNHRDACNHQYDNACDASCNVPDCGYIREVGDHVYDHGCDTDCNLCGTERQVGDHVYDHGCDTDCNECGATRITQHLYDNACDTACNKCGAERQVSDHVYDHGCDTDCNECGAIRSTQHIYDNACDAICNICGDSREVGDHVYDNACDATCNVCGALRQVPDHVYNNDCDTECNVCGVARPITHTFAPATCTTPKTCKICGATEGDVAPHTYIYAKCDDDQHWNECSCGAEEIGSRANHSYNLKNDDAYHWQECSCGYVIEESLHDYTEATCTTPKTCSVCGVTEGEATGHIYTYPCDSSCDVCDATRDASHDWMSATCTDPRICKVCGSEDGEALGHTYNNDCDADCNRCGITREVAAHIWEEGACSVCGVASPTKVKVTTAPKTTYGKEGATVKVTVKATGEGLKYAWYLKNASGTKYSKSSVTSSTYSVKISDSSHGRRIYCIITDKYGNKVQTATVLVRRQATITKEPATVVYAKKNAKASIKITAKGDGLKYTWYIKNDGASKYSKSSVTSATYSATMGSKVKGRRVYCVVTDKYGKKVQSKTFLLRESVSITTQPKTVTVKKNATAKITVKASGDGLKYTWYVKDAGKTKYSKSSITKSTYSVKMTSKVKNRLVYCVVTDKYGKTVKTVTVKLKMK